MTPRWCGADDPLLRPSTDRALAHRCIDAVPIGDDAMERDRLLLADLVALHDDVAGRHCRPGHLTGSAFVVDARATRCLLLFHTKLQRWLQPGGHADGDTNLAAVALREATEESGIDGLEVWSEPIDVDIHRVTPPREDPHLHLDVRFVVRAPAGAVPNGNEESQAIRWVERSDLGGYDLDPGLLRLADAAFALAARRRPV